MTRWRRRYHDHLRCQDCGRHRATVVRWWCSGDLYRVCAQCIKAYRRQLLTHHPDYATTPRETRSTRAQRSLRADTAIGELMAYGDPFTS